MLGIYPLPRTVARPLGQPGSYHLLWGGDGCPATSLALLLSLPPGNAPPSPPRPLVGRKLSRALTQSSALRCWIEPVWLRSASPVPVMIRPHTPCRAHQPRRVPNGDQGKADPSSAADPRQLRHLRSDPHASRLPHACAGPP